MKSDLDRLMQENDIDAILVTGPGDHNPYMVYLTGGAHLTKADLIKKRGEEPILFHASMERDEAARTGLTTRCYADYPTYQDLLKAASGDPAKALALRYQQMLKDAGVTKGHVALYGKTDLGEGYATFATLQTLEPDITFLGFQENVLLKAMATKSEEEVNRIRHMGWVTAGVVENILDFISHHTARGDVLIRSDGEPLTIRDVKRRINLLLAENEAENPEGTIFAIGYDSAVPHSSGTDGDIVRLGQTIVFDIFPCEQGGGYFYDMTRTWCIGYAPDEVAALYEHVFSVYQQIRSELKLNVPFGDYQRRTCELFEAMGHPTVNSDPKTETGFVHSLGHGVGLFIHEQPFSRMDENHPQLLMPGSVFTLEPGLYYPNKMLGVRLEDTYWARPDGQFEILADFPMDLVIPVKSYGQR